MGNVCYASLIMHVDFDQKSVTYFRGFLKNLVKRQPSESANEVRYFLLVLRFGFAFDKYRTIYRHIGYGLPHFIKKFDFSRIHLCTCYQQFV